MVHPARQFTAKKWLRYQAIKINMGEGLKCLFIRKIIQSGKAAYYINPTVWLSGKGKTMETVKIPLFASG